MAVASIRLEESLQMLIDSRLDTIDRILMKQLPRQERLAIVREVESQIYEQLHEQDGRELDRDDVLAVLARLDPPEAYLSDASGLGADFGFAAMPSRQDSPRRRDDTRLARHSGILGIVSLALILGVLASYVVAIACASEYVLFVGGFFTLIAMFVGGLLAFIFGLRSRNSGSLWSITGIATGTIAVVCSSIVGVLGLALLIAEL